MKGRVISLLAAVLWTLITISGEQVAVDDAPRIITNNGHLLFQTGANKGINFETQGNGDIKFNNIGLAGISNQMVDIQTDIRVMKSTNRQCDCNAMNANISRNTRKILNYKTKIKALSDKLKVLLASVNGLKQLSSIDECASNPCKHGGTCIDGFGTYKCLCTDQYKGTNCDEDVNECTQLAGTDIGCQNGARCENYNGGFRCICVGKFTGILCNTIINGCSGSSNTDLCGHGMCIPDHTTSNTRSYNCICDHGWTLDSLTKTCTADVNECVSDRYPCSQIPYVPCSNTRGGFTCGQCPSGYQGNGFTCSDINECLNPNTCAINQDCINIQGSYKCQCVEGMSVNANGVCSRQNICEINNGGCNENAQCTQNAYYAEGRLCVCNNGFVGNGVGSGGCSRTTTSNVTNAQYMRCVRLHLCGNDGSCQETETGFVCRRPIVIVNMCLQNPCLNGGSCEIIQPNNYRCHCRSHFSGRNCETEHTECGGVIIAPRNERVIEFFIGSPQTTTFRYPCVWTIVVSDEQFIQVIPSTINLRGTCYQEYIEMWEKSSTEGEPRRLGKYCEDSSHGRSGYNTTGPVLIIKAALNNAITERHGFSLTIKPTNFVMQNSDCCRCLNNQHVMTSSLSGIFLSPHYPLKYPEGVNCILQFERPFGTRYKVELYIENMDLGDSNGNCLETDYIKIRFAEKAVIKITACDQGTYQNRKFLTSGFRVEFYSDTITSINPSRFKLSWRNVTNEDPCGGIMRFHSTGTIEGPSLSENEEAYCTWDVHNSNTSQMVLLKGFFNNWQNGDCSVFIKIINVDPSGTPRLLFLKCQNQLMLDEMSEDITGKLVIIFKKSIGVATPSFRIQVKYICGETFDMDRLISTEVTSPNYPANYDNNEICSYVFVAKTRRISVSFLDVDINDDIPCQSDFLEIKGSKNEFSNKVFCNGNMNDLIPVDKDPSSTNLVINFRTNASEVGRGFRASVAVTDCGGSYFLDNKMVIAYPEDHLNDSESNINYQVNKLCVWTIKTSPGKYIFSTFDHFHVEYHSNCQYDYLSVSYDNVTERKFCGNDITGFSTKSNLLKLIFKSDFSVGGEGFIMRLYAGSSESNCHQSFDLPQGIIYGPEIGSYGRPFVCLYSITVPKGRKVLLNITITGTIESNSTTPNMLRCYGKGKLKIKNGQLGSATLLDICPFNPPKGIITTSFNKARIIYMVPSYGSQQEFDFTIKFSSIDEECGSIHEDLFGEIASPNYPLFAPRNTYCQWEIRAKQGYLITILISHIRGGFISNTNNCNDQKHPVIKLLSSSQEVYISCENHTYDSYTFEDNVVRIIFKNYESTQYRFRLLYRLSCFSTISKYSGVIESGNIVSGFSAQCQWVINILRGNTLNVHFDYFDLPNPEGEDCKSFVKISDSKSRLLPPTCGNTLLNSTFQTKNSPLIIGHFAGRTPHNVLEAHRGFLLEYATTGCVSEIYYNPNDNNYHTAVINKVGTISSPTFPSSVSNIDCVWTFRSIIGHSVKLKFDVIELDSFHNCSEGYILMAWDTEALNSHPLFRSCERISNNAPITIQSSGSYLKLKFFSANDVDGGQRKFRATYEFVKSSCEYQITAVEGTIKSPNYPRNYPLNANCRWDLSARQGMSIHLHFLDFSLEGHSCRYDYVKIYSQLNSEMMPIAHLCGTDVNSSQLYSSISNEMLVTFKSDYSYQHKGFLAKFFEGCGGQRNATEIRQYLFSPNYPHEYTLQDGLCEWTIVANTSNPGEKVFFYFMGFEGDNANSNTTCSLNLETQSDNSLIIVDGLEDTPVKMVLCSSGTAPPIISSGHYLRVILKSANGRAVFKAGFGTGSSACGGEFFLDDGHFTSPFYPNAVNTEMDCVYYIKGNPGAEIDLTIDDFTRSNEYSYDYFDFLEIRIGSPDNNSLVGRYYTLRDIQNVTMFHKFNDSLLIRFRSQGGQGTNAVKFSARYHINYISEFQSEEGKLASPQFGHLYKESTSRTWTINPNNIQEVNIQFLNFSVGRKLYNNDCTRGKFIVSDFNANTQYLCGADLPEARKYKVPVTLILIADGYRYPGFLLKWSPALNEMHKKIGNCKYEILATETPQILTSPNDNTYNPSLNDCEWTIISPTDRAIDLKMLNFSLEDTENCKYGNFTIKLKRPRSITTGQPILTEHLLSQYGINMGVEKMFCDSQNTSMLAFTKDIIFNKVYITFKVSSLSYNFGFRLQYNLKCYQRIRSLEGWLQNEEFPSVMTGIKSCTYVLTIMTSRFYQLNFTSISLPPKTNGQCLDGYIEIYTTFKLGTYCGSEIPSSLQPLQTNSSFVRITLVGNFNIHQTYSGFQLKYSLNEVEECGGSHILSRESDVITISNPGNNSVSPQHIECKWSFTSLYGTKMKIDLINVYFSTSPLCKGSFLRFYDGFSMLSKKIGNTDYCGNDHNIVSSGNRVLILFRNTNNYVVFKMKISVGSCGGTLTQLSGIIMSPSYPQTYPGKTKCVWDINTFLGFEFIIKFQEFIVDGQCQNANLSIAAKEDATAFNWTSCLNPVETLYVPSSNVRIVFATNTSRPGDRFKILFKGRPINCSGDYSDPSGEIKSNNYPQSLPWNVFCDWRITADVDKRITIRITKLTLGSRCLRISNDRGSIISRICGRNLENYEITTKYNYVRISIIGDGRSSVSFTYDTDQPSLCGGHIHPGFNETGIINFEGSNGGDICHYILHNNPGDTGTLKFKVSNITRFICWKDTIAITSNVDDDLGSSNIFDYANYCKAEDTSLILRTLGKIVRVDVYVDNRFNSSKRASISYRYQDCGGKLTEPYGYISSPNYPNLYPNNTNCEWLIKAPDDMHIRLVIRSLHLEQHNTCKYDRLSIRSGGEFNSPEMKTFCGEHDIANETLDFRQNIIRLSFESDSSVATGGFLIQYNFFSAVNNCNGFIFDVAGSIQTPNYPRPYPSHIHCNWTVVSPEGYQIELTFQEPFDIENASHRQCPYDSLVIYDSNPNRILSRLCGHIPPAKPIKSSQNRIGLYFSSDQNLNLDGFRANYKTVCGGIFNETYGNFKGPMTFIRTFSYITSCEYIIQGWKNHLTNVRIMSSLRNRCYYSNGYMEIWKEVEVGNFVFDRKFCVGDIQSIDVFNHLSIKLKYNVTSYTVDRYALKVSYNHEEMVKEYKNITKRVLISTPQFPNPYYHNANLQWKFQAPPKYIFYVNIIDMDIEDSQVGCLYDYVAFYINEDMNSTLPKLCGKRQMLLTRYDSNNLLIHFVSDSSHFANHTGFKAMVIPTPGPQLGCGQSIVLGPDSMGTISSIDLDNDGLYDNNVFCEWRLFAPESHIIKLIFQNSSVLLEARSRSICKYDWISIYDGSSDRGQHIRTLCGNDSVDPINSLNNHFYIQFRSDFSVTNRGFKIFYSVSASPSHMSVNASLELQSLTSPGYPDSVPFNFQGVANIFAPNNEHIIIELRELSLRSSANCSIDSLEIKDRSLRYPNQFRKFCKAVQFPAPFISSDNSLMAVFRTGDQGDQNSATALKYKLDYKIYSCNRTEKAYSGRIVNIESLKQTKYSHNQRCELVLEAPSTNLRFQFYFQRFLLERSPTCAFDYLQFTFGRVGEEQYTLPRICGEYVPPSFVSNTSTVTITFVTDTNVAHDGFDITYVVNQDPLQKCGGDINLDSGVITSPGYGTNSYEEGQCIWNIALISDKVLTWKITNLQFNSNFTIGQPCNGASDFLKVTSGQSVQTFCGNMNSNGVEYRAPGGIYVEYRSLHGGIGTGFKLEWIGVERRQSGYIFN